MIKQEHHHFAFLYVKLEEGQTMDEVFDSPAIMKLQETKTIYACEIIRPDMLGIRIEALQEDNTVNIKFDEIDSRLGIYVSYVPTDLRGHKPSGSENLDVLPFHNSVFARRELMHDKGDCLVIGELTENDWLSLAYLVHIGGQSENEIVSMLHIEDIFSGLVADALSGDQHACLETTRIIELKSNTLNGYALLHAARCAMGVACGDKFLAKRILGKHYGARAFYEIACQMNLNDQQAELFQGARELIVMGEEELGIHGDMLKTALTMQGRIELRLNAEGIKAGGADESGTLH